MMRLLKPAQPADGWMARVAWCATVGLVGLAPALPCAAQVTWGSYTKPFAAQSPWNSRPVNPVLGSATVPKSQYFPAVAEGAWSSGVFLANATDPAVTIVGPVGAAGVWDPDSEAFKPSITLPRWPKSVIPASAADGHADVVDPISGVIHSFWKLRNDNGTWRATQYAWTKLNGRGWGDPAHYFQGARAVAVPPSGGLIRKHEVNNGDSQYRHALAVSLTHNALAKAPAYVFPATSADADVSTNTGAIAEGALLMLPASFNIALISTPALRKVVETLKTYGAYVVDRNSGTPFVIYVENGSGFNLHPNGWNNTAAKELDIIRAALRPLASTGGWVDGDGKAYTPVTKQNMLSMRGTWAKYSGTRNATFDTWRQALVFNAGTNLTTAVNYSNRSTAKLNWSQPTVGKKYRFTAVTSGGATVRFEVVDNFTKKVSYSTGYLKNGATATFNWPTASYSTVLWATSGTDGSAATVAPTLHQLN